MILSIIKIFLINLALSGDNVGIIALAIKDLSDKDKKKISFLGISLAIILRVFFSIFIIYIMKLKYLHINFIGGLLLAKITLDFIKTSTQKTNITIKESTKASSALMNIILADAVMSLDNSLAIAALSDGNFICIIIGLLMSIPILFYGSNWVSKLLDSYPICIYIITSLLGYTAVKILLEDSIFISILPIWKNVFIYTTAAILFIYGILNSKKKS